MSNPKTKKKKRISDLTKETHWGDFHNLNFVAPGRRFLDSITTIKTDATLRLSTDVLGDRILSLSETKKVAEQLANWLRQNLPWNVWEELKKELKDG